MPLWWLPTRMTRSPAYFSVRPTATLRNSLQQMLPEHAGGAFETATKPSRLAADILAQPGRLHGIWLQQVGWNTSKSVGNTSSYDLSGWGAVGGYDVPVGAVGSVGVTLGYYYGRDHHSGSDLASNHYEAGVYWQGGAGRCTPGPGHCGEHRL